MAEKSAEKSADKPAKPTVKNGSKVFDIAKPGKQQASATSRPVIVTNRPIMQDPMMLSNQTMADSADQSGPSRGKLKIQPLTDEEKKSSGTAKKDDKPSKTADLPTSIQLADGSSSDGSDTELPVIKVDTKTPVKEKPTDPFPEERPSGERPADMVPTKDTVGTDIDTAKTPGTHEQTDDIKDDQPIDAPDDEPVDTDAASVTLVAPAETSTDTGDNSTSNEAGTSELGVNEKAAAELEADAKKAAALDELVENKTYFLPINSVEKRRSAVVSVLGTLLIIMLGLFLVNLMMDVGTLEIESVKPLTNFFGN